MHTFEYIAALKPGGPGREFFKKASPGAEAWVDEFCDGLVLRLSLQERLEALPPSNVNLWCKHGKGIWQVNVDVGRTGGWRVNTGDDLLVNLVKTLTR